MSVRGARPHNLSDVFGDEERQEEWLVREGQDGEGIHCRDRSA